MISIPTRAKNYLISEFLPISHYKDMKTVYCGGIQITGVQTKLAPYRQLEKATPLIKKYSFVPFETERVGTVSFVAMCIQSMISTK